MGADNVKVNSLTMVESSLSGIMEHHAEYRALQEQLVNAKLKLYKTEISVWARPLLTSNRP